MTPDRPSSIQRTIERRLLEDFKKQYGSGYEIYVETIRRETERVVVTGIIFVPYKPEVLFLSQLNRVIGRLESFLSPLGKPRDLAPIASKVRQSKLVLLGVDSKGKVSRVFPTYST
jgi:hypothetical protein